MGGARGGKGPLLSVGTVYAVFANADEAERIARTVVEERLAACANILGPCKSIYRWNGAVETASEVPALFKTSLASADALIARICALHSYDCPAVLLWPVERLASAYGDWVEANA